MQKRFLYTIPLIFALAGIQPATEALAHEPLYRNGTQIFLIRPDGSELDYIPEYGSVTMGQDAYGRQTLLDFNGDIVATEMTAREMQAYRRSVGGSDTGAGWGRNADHQNARWSDPRDRGWFRAQDRAWGTRDANRGAGNNHFSGLGPSQPLPRPEASAPDQTTDTRAFNASEVDMNVVALQTFLDRAGFSPGVIDGRMGNNVQKALDAYRSATGRTLAATGDSEEILSSLSLDGGLPMTSYTITAKDAAGPYVASIPSDYGQKAQLASLSYTSVPEMLAEKFHMDERLLKSLNPDADFSRPGTTIKVVNPGTPKKATVSKIIADKSKKQLLAYDAEDRLVAAYPATIGSSDTPSPSGTVTVERIALDPSYTYNPQKNFRQGNNDRVLTINPGPNGPVGDVWIALSKPSYGIHGTPEPAKIGKTSSHGCVRLTNWDARELAGMVSPGVTVEFID